MKLYDFMKLTEADYDTYDTEYDACVTACYIGEADAMDNYYRFCIEITKKVEVVRKISDICVVCDWSKLIRDNMEKFKAFTKKHWKYAYENDEDEFIYQWINEIHSYMAGCVSENFYNILIDFVNKLEV